jgi:F0F1-type ATP synthase epsilon subunit
MKLFKLCINTPDGVSYEDQIFQIELTTPNGVMAILADMIPTIGAVLPSLCYIRNNKNERIPAVINSGLFKMDGKTIHVVTDFFEIANNINESVFQRRQQMINNVIKDKHVNDDAYKAVQLKLEKELNQLRKLAGF